MTRYKLFPYQEEGVRFLKNRTKCLLTSEMGTGKTCQVLQAIDEICSEKINVLVVAPAGLLLMWDRAVREWYDNYKIVHMKGHKDAVTLSGKYRFVLVSYNYVQKPENVARLNKCRWHVMVCEEAHAIKSWSSKQTKGVHNLTADRKWLLTGTPATRSGQDYYSYFKLVEGAEKWGTYKEFSEKYCVKRLNRWSGYFEYKELKPDKELEVCRAFGSLMLRHRKCDVLKYLPPKMYQDIPVEVDKSVVAECLALGEGVVERCIENDVALPGHVMKVLRSIGLSKVEECVEIVLNADQPIVVFCIHTDVVENLRDRLVSEGKRVGCITGAESREAKDLAVQQFQGGELDVVICNVIAGGAGITLTRSSYVVFLELHWSPAVMRQCEDRCHRIGTVANCVNVVRLVGAGTIDEAVCKSLKKKERMMKAVMND